MAKENQAEKKSWIKEFQKVAILNTAFSLFFNLLPFWAGMLMVLSVGKWTDWSRFYSSGEFYLYSSSFLSSAYLIYHNNKVKVADLSSVFSIISIALIVVTSILYAFLAANGNPPINVFIKWASIISILISIPLFYYSQIIANKPSPDVGEQRHEEQQTIINNLS
jgi:hypothetical protein